MQNLQIVCHNLSDPLVRYAVEELQRYVRLLFGVHLEHVEKPTVPFVLIGDQAGLPPLGDQEYVITRQRREGMDCVVCTGGSAIATLWSVYELVEHWGVHFMVQGDVLPDDPGVLRLPDADLLRRPVFKRRGFRVINDMANSGVFWSLADHKRLFDQLAKMRFNAILIVTYPHQPWVHWSFRGVERNVADLCYGFKHPIHSQTIGRELFGGVSNFTNSDFQGAETYEEKLAAGRRFMTGLIEAAHARGLAVNFMQLLSDMPLEILRHLPEWSEADGVHLPENVLKQPQCARLGLAQVGGDPAVDVYRSPLNPVFVDMAESWFRAHIEAYPNVEYYGLGQPEFPPGGAGVKECWDALDRKYDLEERFPLAELEERARSTHVTSLMPPERMVAELYGAIQTLRLFDIILNERRVIERSGNPHAKVAGDFMSEYAYPLVPFVMPPDTFEFMAIVDYLPSHVAQRLHTLSFAKGTTLPVSMITTIEDDNVGFFPQLTTQSLHKTVQGMREYGLQGFWFRQFNISEHEPSMYYMARAAWDEHVTPESAYGELVQRVCGQRAVQEILTVFHMVEELEQHSNALCGVGFLMPDLYMKMWRRGDSDNRERLLEYVARVTPMVKRMEAVLDTVEPRGKRWTANYHHFLRFASEYPLVVAKIIEARVTYDVAKQRQAEKDFYGYGETMDTVVAMLQEAVQLSEKALRTWSELVVNPTDLGTLAALNAYGHDYLKGLAWQVYLEGQYYGFSLT